jgi:hypothetical protein
MTKKLSVKPYKPNPKYKTSVLKEFPELYNWIKQVSRFCKVEDFIYISDYKKGEIRLKIFTKDNEYRISACLPDKKCPVCKSKKIQFFPDIGEDGLYGCVSCTIKKELKPIRWGYLGCIADTRKPRAGEDWNRGRDLADGNYSKRTWQEIKDDILAYELVKVVRNSPDKEAVKGKVVVKQG